MEILSNVAYHNPFIYFLLFIALSAGIAGLIFAIKADKEITFDVVSIVASIILAITYFTCPLKRIITVKTDDPSIFTVVFSLSRDAQITPLNESNKFEILVSSKDADIVIAYLNTLSN